ncbi:SusC/RagA family TonB-linked outer membrane protein [Cyclobacterium sp. SYSU L10401]|uniref:SusC/RagA family TonB-linked outer membrane protein n=1 Tax=Cyclobacterium sp. SYSU L10401 TaxID=2678657 RepID=UPI0013D8A182|nr:TonB-dependent receptor [Cyclobacterium sp. SYSU L10401]
MKRKLLYCGLMKSISSMVAILFCLVSGGLMAQESGLDKNLKNIEKDLPALASNEALEGGKLEKAMDVTVTGTVTDENGQPIPGATVSVPGTSIGTATDLDGKYSITVPEDASLVFSFIGFESQTIEVDNRSTIDITLTESAQALDEVVVVGYGTQEKVNLTGAVGVAGSDRLVNRPVANVAEGLQGVIPNLNIEPRNGDPSQSPSFNVRGFTSINGGQPLVLVDNVPMNLNQINPNDIESVSVLKDASAAAVYGARAAFGVILVTTKSGKEGKVNVSLNSQVSLAKPIFNMDPVNDPHDFVNARNIANERTNGVPSYDPDWVEGTRRWSENPIPENEWRVVDDALRFYGFNNYQDEIMTDFAPTQQHDLTISGGSETSSFFVSFGHLNKDGYLNSDRNENFKRYNVLMKGDFQVTDWLKLTEKVIVNTQKSDKPYFYNWDVNINSLARVNPIMPIQFPDLPFYREEGDREQYEQYIGMYFGGTNFWPYLEDGGRNQWRSNDIWLDQGIELTPVKGLSIRGNFAYNFYNRTQQEVASRVEIVNNDLRNPNDMTNFGFSGNDFISERNDMDQYYVINAVADYKFDLPEQHKLNTMIGYNQEWGQNKFVRAQNNTLITPLIQDLNATIGMQQTFGGNNHMGLRGAFYRVNYIFDDRYLIESNGRYDGTSRFPTDDRFGFFPSLSVGWRISNENWMSSSSNWLDELKIRASYGTLGNQLLGNNFYPYIPTMGIGQSSFMMSAGQRTPFVSPAGLVSPTLTWETVISQNLGVDFALFGGKLSGAFDVFTRDTEDMLMRQEYPSLLGTGAPQTNAADLRTYGWEMELTYRNQFTSDLNYDVTLALSDWQATITRFDNPSGALPSGNQYYEGQMLNEIWGYETVGIFQSQEEVDNAADQSNLGANWRPGDIQYADLNNDGRITPGNNTLENPGDRRIIGNSTPRYSFGINNNLQWKNFTLNLFFQGVWSRDHWPTSGNWTWFFPFNAGHVEKYFITDSWSEDNRDAYFPHPHISTNDKKNIQTQTRFLQNAGYIRLKNVNLGYNLPANWMQSIGFQSANIYFAGMNLWEYSPIRPPLDPETIWAGAIEYPMQRIYTLGARITF